MKQKIVFFDFETTGLDPYKGSKIIQIGAVAIHESELLKPVGEIEEIESFERKIIFDANCCSDFILDLIGYTPAKWRAAVERDIALRDFKSFIGRHATVQARYGLVTRLGGHNVAGFDMHFLKVAYGKRGPKIDYHPVDTISMAIISKILGNTKSSNLKLGTLYKIATGGKTLDGAHDALVDVRASMTVAQYILNGLVI